MGYNEQLCMYVVTEYVLDSFQLLHITTYPVIVPVGFDLDFCQRHNLAVPYNKPNNKV